MEVKVKRGMLWQTADFPTAQIDAVLDHAKFKGAVLGVSVQTLGGETLYDRNSDFRLMPASNQKILSVAYALWKLGPEYAPVTKFWKSDQGIYVDSPGDPSMTYDRLVAIRKRLGAAPHKKVFVAQAYRPGYGPGWEWDDLPNRYAPTISAFTFDTASFELWGSPKGFWIKSNPFGIKIVHAPWKTGPNQFDLATKRLVVTGNRPKTESKIEAFALPNPDHLAASLLGGSLISAKEFPKTAPRLSEKGDTIAILAKACLAPSDNFIAESLLLMAANAEGPLPADEYAEANKRMKKFLVEVVGLEPEDVDPYDGSGLSRHNNVTPIGLIKVLNWAKKQSWAEQWTAAMASPGTGTLKNRLQNSGFRGKTGTLNKASSLSGYVKCKDGRELAVSIMMNHYLGGDSMARGAQDEIIRIIEGASLNGPILANHRQYVDVVSNSKHRFVDADRVCGPYFDRHAASTRLDRRTESDHAATARPRRMAVHSR